MTPNNIRIITKRIDLLLDKFENTKLSEADWIEIFYECTDIINNPDIPLDQKRRIWPLGLTEISGMIYSGIKYRRNEPNYDYAKTKEEKRRIREYDLKLAKEMRDNGKR